MTTTNRTLNRLVLLAVGLLVLAAGGAVLLVALAPATVAAGAVRDAVESGRAWLGSTVAQLGSVEVHTIGAAVGVVLAVVALVLAIARGGGRTDVAHEDVVTRAGQQDADGGVAGRVVLDATAVADLLRAGTPATTVADLGLSAWRHRDRIAWRVRVRPAVGTGPTQAVAETAEQIRVLRSRTGTDVPVLVEVLAGSSARVPPA